MDTYQQGGTVPKRIGVRENSDGTSSSHLMRAEKINDSTWAGFPSLFQNKDKSWLDLSKGNWMDAYEEALKRKEVVNFGRDSIKALEYGKGSWKKNYQKGGVIEDDKGQLAHPGKITKINSNNITMKGVNYPVLGVSNTGDEQMMMPGEDYKFDGESVTEYPLLDKSEKSSTFTGYNTWMNKYTT